MAAAAMKRTSEFVLGKQLQYLENEKDIEECITLKVKMRLYEAIILSILLYSAELWQH